MTRVTAVAAAVLLALGPNVSPARGQGQVALAVPGSYLTNYATPVLVLAVRELTFVNGDIQRHDVVQDVLVDRFGGAADRAWCADATLGGWCPAFWSPLIRLGQTTAVLGLDQLVAGATYSFYCTIHPSMKGKLMAA